MIDKNIFQDILLQKKNLMLILFSNIIQTCLLSAASYIIAYLANKLLFSQLNYDAAAPLLVLLLFFFCLKAVLNYFNNITIENISLNLQNKIRYKLLQSLAYNTDIKDKSEGEWLAIITKGVDKLDSYITAFLPQLGLLITLPPILLICAFINDWISGIIFLITAPLIPFFMILIGKIADKENKKQWELFQQLTSYISDLLPGLLVLKAYNQAEQQLKTANENSNKFSSATLKVLRIAFISAFMLEFIATLSIAIIAVNIGLRLLYNQTEFLPVFFILLIAPQFYQPFRQFGAAFHSAMNGISASTEIYQIIKAFDKQKSSHTLNTVLQTPPQIQFKHINYRYPPNNNLWKELNFTIPAGKQTVLIGENGVGKSTILKMILQLIYPNTGNIYINNEHLSNINPDKWHEQIGYAAQEPYVYSTTIAENIALGRKSDFESVKRAAEIANLDKFIQTLPNGYNTIIGDKIQLSLGQKRRLGIARAFFNQPKLLLLDEPMENLDYHNEELIQNLLNSLKGKVTILIIAHRTKTIKQADHIVLIKNNHAFEYETVSQVPFL